MYLIAFFDKVERKKKNSLLRTEYCTHLIDTQVETILAYSFGNLNIYLSQSVDHCYRVSAVKKIMIVREAHFGMSFG